VSEFTWSQDQAAFSIAAERLAPSTAERDQAIAQLDVIEGQCPVCRLPTVFTVHTGATFDGRPNLREGLRCRRCGLTARQRLVFAAIAHQLQSASAVKGALLERTSRLYRQVHSRWPGITGSEYLGAERIPGRAYWWSTHSWRWRRSRHETITALSYATGSLDVIVHSDVLEHVYDTRLAIRECARVLRDGGAMLFTAPFFASLPTSILRGRPLPGGGIEHFEPPEYHGDGVSSTGIYTYHSFGWDLLDMLRENGFGQAEIGLRYAPDEGWVSADPPAAAHPWSMLPIVFRATKGAAATGEEQHAEA
jgi:SAM-dependent methyltransferase